MGFQLKENKGKREIRVGVVTSLLFVKSVHFKIVKIHENTSVH